MAANRRDELVGLLDRSALGDADAFAAYMDHTIDAAWRLAGISAKTMGRRVDEVVIEQVVRNMYSRAWKCRSQYRASRLSPRAWILSFTRASVAALEVRPRP